MLLLLAVCFSIFFGVKRGEWKRIERNAKFICTSCIGLGK